MQIDIMKINALFTDIRRDYGLGTDLETAVKNAIARYCVVAS
jgi:hypothetical protein